MSAAVVAVFVPIVAILAGIAIGIVGIVVSHRQKLQRAELRHRERLAAIDKGFELPPDPIESDGKRHDAGRFLRQGLVLIAVSATVTAGMIQLPDPNVPYLFGLVPGAIGIAYLLYFFLYARHEAEREAVAAASPADPRTP